MIIRKQFTKLELGAGDKVVAATPWRDMMFIVTERGYIYTVRMEMQDD